MFFTKEPRNNSPIIRVKIIENYPERINKGTKSEKKVNSFFTIEISTDKGTISRD